MAETVGWARGSGEGGQDRRTGTTDSTGHHVRHASSSLRGGDLLCGDCGAGGPQGFRVDDLLGMTWQELPSGSALFKGEMESLHTLPSTARLSRLSIRSPTGGTLQQTAPGEWGRVSSEEELRKARGLESPCPHPRGRVPTGDPVAPGPPGARRVAGQRQPAKAASGPAGCPALCPLCAALFLCTGGWLLSTRRHRGL